MGHSGSAGGTQAPQAPRVHRHPRAHWDTQGHTGTPRGAYRAHMHKPTGAQARTRRHPDTQVLRHRDTEPQRHRETQTHRDAETQRQRDRETEKHGNSGKVGWGG